MNVLVADDEEPCRDLVRDLFADDPTMVITFARDGAEAWWLLTAPKAHFDVGVFDVSMPVVDGLSLIERIRGSVQLRHLPVILCTGINDRDTVARAARLAINFYLVKPYRPDSLRDKIRAAAPKRGVAERTLLSG